MAAKVFPLAPKDDQDEEQREADASRIKNEGGRVAALRSFTVVMADASIRTMFAHYHDTTSPAGHLSFTTVQPTGAPHMEHVLHSRIWNEVHEIITNTAAESVN